MTAAFAFGEFAPNTQMDDFVLSVIWDSGCDYVLSTNHQYLDLQTNSLEHFFQTVSFVNSFVKGLTMPYE